MSDPSPSAQDFYQTLRDKVDQQFDHIYNKYPNAFQCGKQCHACCQPDLSISQLEADGIKLYLHTQPHLVEQLKQLQQKNPHKNQRCEFLDKSGLCSIYPVRPLICRSHGAPILVQIDKKKEALDCCPLNFEEGLQDLQPGDWIHLETLNTMLTLINRYQPSHSDTGKRVALMIDALLTD